MGQNWDKRQIATLVACFDILTISIFMFTTMVLHHLQISFAEAYDSQTVESRDFTVKIKKLPNSFQQYSNENSLKFALWNEIQDAI